MIYNSDIARSSTLVRTPNLQRGFSIKSSLFGPSSTIFGPPTDNPTIFEDVILPEDGNENFGNKEIKNKKNEKLEEKIRTLKQEKNKAIEDKVALVEKLDKE